MQGSRKIKKKKDEEEKERGTTTLTGSYDVDDVDGSRKSGGTRGREATSSGSFLRTTIPPRNRDPLLKGTTRRAEEED